MRPSGNAAHRIANADRILLILDYDGTLSPIASRPEEAFLPRETREALAQLTELSCLQVCIMSGRSLEDLRERVEVPGLIYIGSHGLEAQGIHFEVPGMDGARIRNSMKEFQSAAERSLPGLEGLIIENKGFSVAVHYRLVDEDQASRIREILEKLMTSFPEARLTFGKKVFEVRPDIKWDKGTMAIALLHELRASDPGTDILPIYIGDDLTDEDAFIALSKKGITILVDDGKRETQARYRVGGTQDVLHLLQELGDFLRGRGGCTSFPERELNAWAELGE